jgi:hypothetical protein
VVGLQGVEGGVEVEGGDGESGHDQPHACQDLPYCDAHWYVYIALCMFESLNEVSTFKDGLISLDRYDITHS